jgi:urea transport system ATP-binding protein
MISHDVQVKAASEAREALLFLGSVSAGYGDIPIVHDVTLSLPPGEVLALVGRNGVGKTTLVKAIARLLKLGGGEIWFRATDVSRSSAADMARLGMGYVPQGRGTFSRLTVEENLQMGELIGDQQRSQHDDQVYDQVYALFPVLKQRRKQKAGTLSGGEQKMLAIGRVLIGRPSILVLDEPSEGIQPSIIQQIAEVIREQNRQNGLTVLLVEQNIDLVAKIADRCAVMEKGSIIAELTPEALMNPETAKEFLAI